MLSKKVELRQERSDLLELCHTVPMEVTMAGEGTGQTAGGWGFAFSASGGLWGHPGMVITASALLLSFSCLLSQRSSSWTRALGELHRLQELAAVLLSAWHELPA